MKPGRTGAWRKGCLGVSGCGCASLVVGFVLLMALGYWRLPGPAGIRDGRWSTGSRKRESVREVLTRVAKEGWQDELAPAAR